MLIQDHSVTLHHYVTPCVVLLICRCVEQLSAMSKQDTPSNNELTALMQCALSGASGTALVAGLVRGLQTGQDTASPKILRNIALRFA